MSSHYKWYPSSEEVVVPWNARYSFPSQANKAIKITPRIPPKSGQTFAPGQIIRIEFPAQGYVNPTNTTLEFDCTIVGPTYSSAGNDYLVRFQNNIQSIFQRVRLLYGATPLEDILNYNVIIRALTEWTATNQINTMDDASINEGIGQYIMGADQVGNYGFVNTRQTYIHGVQNITPAAAANFTGGTQITAVVPNGVSPLPGVVIPSGALTATRRYQVNFALGLFTQDKLIPVKFMASQLAIEITLETAQGCMFYSWFDTRVGTESSLPVYYVGNVNLIPEILEFDSSYDAMFLRGLREGGVPIKFSSWHSFFFSSAQSSSINLLIQERSRSVKALFAVQRQAQQNFAFDNGALLFDTAAGGTSTLQTFQFRIGGRYFPAAPVQCATTLGSATSNGGAEAYMELQKALNCVGDYRLAPSVNTLRWALQNSGLLNIYDTHYNFLGYQATGVSNLLLACSGANSFCGNLPSACFGMAIDLETSNGMEISGLNAEEQSDIALLANWTSPQVTAGFATASSIEVYSYYDAMIVLRENNVLELIQ